MPFEPRPAVVQAVPISVKGKRTWPSQIRIEVGKLCMILEHLADDKCEEFGEGRRGHEQRMEINVCEYISARNRGFRHLSLNVRMGALFDQ